MVKIFDSGFKKTTVISSLKGAIILLCGLIILFVVYGYLNSESNDARKFIYDSPVISEQLGKIESVHLKKSIQMQQAMGHDGKINPAYKIYQYIVMGNSRKAEIKIRESMEGESEERFIIEQVNLLN